MKILVGTLYCGENEFPECVASVQAQTHRDWEQFVVRDLPNKLAHETLYETFMSRASEFDLFLKLDADMVFENPTILEQIETYFQRHPQLDGITICVHDLMTDAQIHGMHVYRSSVRWQRHQDMLFTDKTPVSPEKFRIGVKELAPAASHCRNPSPFFAFHFGVHRGLKARQSRDNSSAAYLREIEQVWNHFRRKWDQRLGLAVLGAEMALAGNFAVADLDYGSQSLREVSARYQDLSLDDLVAEILKYRSEPGSKIRNRRIKILNYRIWMFLDAVRSGIKPALVQCVPRRIRHAIRDRIRGR